MKEAKVWGDGVGAVRKSVGKAENAFVDTTYHPNLRPTPAATPHSVVFQRVWAYKRKKLLCLSLEKVNFLHFHHFFSALDHTIIIVILGFLVFAGS